MSYFALAISPLPSFQNTILLPKHYTQCSAAELPPPPPSPSPLKSKPRSLLTAIFKAADHVIDTFIDPPRKSSLDPKHVLTGNFAPVDELPPTECSVIEGNLPKSLDGAYIRNGPNPQFFPCGPYHFFDGDGMLHAITIADGKAKFCSRFVKTYKYQVEKEKGHSVFHSVFSGFTSVSALAARGSLTVFRRIAGEYDPDNGSGVVNTSLALIAGKLYALGESDQPYGIEIRSDGEIHTIGRHDFAGKLAANMTAHPKTDPETGETFSFRYGPFRPFATFFKINSDGEKQPDVPIFSIKDPCFLHDFAITKKYVIFNENQIVINPFEILNGGALLAASPGKVPRIGIIPRYAADESKMRWFEAAGLNLIHIANAWDEDNGNSVVIVGPNILSIDNALEDLVVQSSMEMVSIDLRRGTVVRRRLSGKNLEFSTINDAFVGKKHRYVYAGIGDPTPKISGIVKLDISLSKDAGSECVVSHRQFGPGCYAGEPIFVPRSPENPNTTEDDGYLVAYLHDEATEESRFMVMDAKSPELDIVAVVQLPRRVPYGFHGIFVRESEMKNL